MISTDFSSVVSYNANAHIFNSNHKIYTKYFLSLLII